MPVQLRQRSLLQLACSSAERSAARAHCHAVYWQCVGQHQVCMRLGPAAAAAGNAASVSPWQRLGCMAVQWGGCRLKAVSAACGWLPYKGCGRCHFLQLRGDSGAAMQCMLWSMCGDGMVMLCNSASSCFRLSVSGAGVGGSCDKRPGDGWSLSHTWAGFLQDRGVLPGNNSSMPTASK